MTQIATIQSHIAALDPPPLVSSDVLNAARGTRQALADCGYFPEVGTIDDYLRSQDLAGQAVYRCLAIWERFCCRFDLGDLPIERAPMRLFARYNACNGWWISRSEAVKLLAFDPAAGCA
jgi:hypothetical protein